jgi:hypothetical protein
MRRIAIFLIMAAGLSACRLCFAATPHEIAGFILGADISQYRDLIQEGSQLPIRHREYLTEVEVRAPEGFKSGIIIYGSCAAPGKILKISMKYADRDKAFYEALLTRFKAQFGEPAEWRGDPFHVYVSWKWSFTDDRNNRISMTLQHFSGDDDEYKSGNSVKLAITSAIEKEQACYEKGQPKSLQESPSGQKLQPDYQRMPLDRFIPR